MAWMDLGSPRPKQQPDRYTPFVWPDGHFRLLTPQWVSQEELADGCSAERHVLRVLARRRSKRTFSRLDMSELSQLLWHCARTQATSPSPLGFELEQRPTPSGGAIHPIHLLVKLAGEPQWCRYDSRVHALVDVVGSADLLRDLLAHSEFVLPGAEATRILLVAEPGKTQAKYEDAASVIWRDAGALLAIMAVVAEALGSHFCPLGITGEPWASRLAPPGILAGVGMALIGNSPE